MPFKKAIKERVFNIYKYMFIFIYIYKETKTSSISEKSRSCENAIQGEKRSFKEQVKSGACLKHGTEARGPRPEKMKKYSIFSCFTKNK